MRTLVTALVSGSVVVGLLAAPSMAVLNVKLIADKTTLNVGDTAVVSVQMNSSSATKGIGQLGGSIVASGASALITNNDWRWTPGFTASVSPVSGTPGANGAMSNFGSAQPASATVNTLGVNSVWVTVATYSVTGRPFTGTITLTYVPAVVGGFGPVKSVFIPPSADSTLGVSIPLTYWTPEPATVSLLALGGLFVARRRRA